MTTQRRDLIAGAVFAALAIGFYRYATLLPSRPDRPVALNPGFYPGLLGLLLGVLALVQIGQALARIRRERGSTAPADAAVAALPPVWKHRRALETFAITVGLLVLYPFVLRTIGFVPTGVVFLGLLFWRLSPGARSRVDVALLVGVTAGLTALTFVVFRLILRIPFPAGTLFR